MDHTQVRDQRELTFYTKDHCVRSK